MVDTREPDLLIERILNRSHITEGLEFYIDEDHLEINCWNADSDLFTIILNPEEVKQLKELLEKVK